MSNLDSQHIATTLNLGTLTQAPKHLDSGLFSTVWQIKTHASYIIKFIKPTVSRSLADYEYAEQLALQFQNQGIPAVAALEFDGQQLQYIDSRPFFVYPYIDGTTLPRTPASRQDAECMGHQLGNLHQSAKAQISTEGLIPSHRDLNPHNVIWDLNHQPHIIDWEWAGFIEPDFDAFHTALMWAGLMEAQFTRATYDAFMQGYQQAGEHVTRAIPDLLQELHALWQGWLLLVTAVDLDATNKHREIQQISAVLDFLVDLRPQLL